MTVIGSSPPLMSSPSTDTASLFTAARGAPSAMAYVPSPLSRRSRDAGVGERRLIVAVSLPDARAARRIPRGGRETPRLAVTFMRAGAGDDAPGGWI